MCQRCKKLQEIQKVKYNWQKVAKNALDGKISQKLQMNAKKWQKLQKVSKKLKKLQKVSKSF